jgi:hypothetical protein
LQDGTAALSFISVNAATGQFNIYSTSDLDSNIYQLMLIGTTASTIQKSSSVNFQLTVRPTCYVHN